MTAGPPTTTWQSFDEDLRGHWAHHGVAVMADGDVVAIVGRHGRLVRRSPDGGVSRVRDLGIGEAHGLLVALIDGHEQLVAAVAFPPGDDGTAPGAVHVTDPVSGAHWTFDPPQHEAYVDIPYRPTAAAIDATGQRIWVADGYGASLVHEYEPQGAYRGTLPSVVDGVPLACPHHLLTVDGQLLVTDRLNHRIISVADGVAHVVVPPGILDLPGALALDRRGRLLVGELAGRISVFEPRTWRLLGHVADGTAARHRGGWPNGRDEAGATVPPTLEEGALHAPHSLASHPDGGTWVTEWHTGGRLVRLVVA